MSDKIGKATTNTNSDGSLSFDCQHGPTECEANMIHACSIEAIHDTRTRLDMVSCMIRDNINPKESFNRVRVPKVHLKNINLI